MAPPQLFIISKTVELKKQTDNDNEDRSEAVVAENDQQESRAEKKDERYENDVADPTGTEESDGEKENRNAKSLRPAHILVFFALAVAFVGAYLWKDDLVFRYFFVLGFHLFLLGWLHIALTPGLHVGTIFSICNISFTVLEIHIWLNCNWEYTASYGLQAAGLILSICLAFPWPLLLLWSNNSCTTILPSKETIRKLTDLLERKQVQVRKTITSLLPSLLDPNSSSSFKITVPTSANPLPHCYLQQTVVITIMLLAATMLLAQQRVMKMTPSATPDWNQSENTLLQKLRDPVGTYSTQDSWSLLGLPYLDPAQTKLMSVIASPVAFLLCLPLFFLNLRLSFASLVITSLLTIPLGFAFAFLSVYTVNWLVLLLPDSLDVRIRTLSLALRILIAIIPSVIAALFSALKLSYLENYTRQTNKKKATPHWICRYTSTIVALAIVFVAIGGLAAISRNLMLQLSSFIPFDPSHPAAPVFQTFATAHLGFSTITMVIALLVFLVGHNISGLTSLFLGSGGFSLTIATIVYYFLCLRGFMDPLLSDILHTEFIFLTNASVGLLVSSLLMYEGSEAFVELVACLLDALLVPPLLVSLALLASARGILSLASLPSIKVSISVRATCEDPENRMDTKTNETNEQV